MRKHIPTECSREYAKNAAEIRSLLKVITAKVRQHGRRQRADAQNWGFPGDLSHIIHELRDIALFLFGNEAHLLDMELKRFRKATAGRP